MHKVCFHVFGITVDENVMKTEGCTESLHVNHTCYAT